MNDLVTLKNITKSFGAARILTGLSFAIGKGEILGFLGANGAGKTTTIRLLLSLLSPDTGRIEFADGLGAGKIGFILDSDGLYDGMSALENLYFYQRLYGRKTNKVQAGELLATVGLAGNCDKKAGAFSKGMRQRLSLARALVNDPGLLILDEPMTGLDPAGRLQFRELILQLAGNENRTVFFSSHNLDETQKICTRIVLLDQGKVRLQGRTDELLAREQGRITVEADTEPSETVKQALIKDSFFAAPEWHGALFSFTPKDSSLLSLTVRKCESHGLYPVRIGNAKASLEELYRTILAEREGAREER